MKPYHCVVRTLEGGQSWSTCTNLHAQCSAWQVRIALGRRCRKRVFPTWWGHLDQRHAHTRHAPSPESRTQQSTMDAQKHPACIPICLQGSHAPGPVVAGLSSGDAAATTAGYTPGGYSGYGNSASAGGGLPVTILSGPQAFPGQGSGSLGTQAAGAGVGAQMQMQASLGVPAASMGFPGAGTATAHGSSGPPRRGHQSKGGVGQPLFLPNSGGGGPGNGGGNGGSQGGPVPQHPASSIMCMTQLQKKQVCGSRGGDAPSVLRARRSSMRMMGYSTYLW